MRNKLLKRALCFRKKQGPCHGTADFHFLPKDQVVHCLMEAPWPGSSSWGAT